MNKDFDEEVTANKVLTTIVILTIVFSVILIPFTLLLIKPVPADLKSEGAYFNTASYSSLTGLGFKQLGYSVRKSELPNNCKQVMCTKDGGYIEFFYNKDNLVYKYRIQAGASKNISIGEIKVGVSDIDDIYDYFGRRFYRIEKVTLTTGKTEVRANKSKLFYAFQFDQNQKVRLMEFSTTMDDRELKDYANRLQ